MKEKSLNILLVEDNEGDARLFREMLRDESPDRFTLTHLPDMRAAEQRLAKHGVDLVLLDLGLPDEQGLNTVRRAHAAAPNVPIIVLTGLDDEVLAAEALKEGAQDYLVKGQIENRALPRFLRHAMERHRMLAENDRIKKQQLQLKDEFLSHVSHELRSPLTSIYSFTTIIADNLAGETTQRQQDYLQIILRNVRQLQNMIEDLLEVTKSQAGKLTLELECASIPDAVAYAIESHRASAGARQIELSHYFPGHLPATLADPVRLRQILTILLDNAIKFTPDGGKVNVQARLSEEEPGFLLVDVADTGCGISPEMTERIFEHLYQIADHGREGRKGLGLGLHIAKELVTRQGGRIWVTSEPSKGSHFFVTVPIFSLAKIIAPILTHEQLAGESIALLAVGICTLDGSPEVPRESLDLVRKLLRECLRPDSDALLPNVNLTSERKLYYAVAYTQEHGADIIGKRIQTHLNGSELLRQENLTFAVSHSFLDPLLRGENEPMEIYAERLAAAMQDHIANECRQGRNETWPTRQF